MLKHLTYIKFITLILCFVFIFSFFVFKKTQAPTYTNESNTPNKEVKILIFGDMMLDRGIRQKINETGPEYPFELIKNELSDNDIVVANAEGPFTNFDSVTLGTKNGPLIFTFDPTILKTLKKLGFTLLGQANNHTLDFGNEGFYQSTTSITLAGLSYFGDPLNMDISPYIKEINGEKIGLIAYNEFSYQGKDKVISKIEGIKKEVSYLIVYPHWGEEYNQSFTLAQKKTAHDFIDAGADVVIGTHPHVIEPIEIYKGKPIFYSIGNFIFDQFQIKSTTEGLFIQILLSKNSITYKINPFSIKHAQASLMDTENRQTVLDLLQKNIVNTDDSKENITTGTITILR